MPVHACVRSRGRYVWTSSVTPDLSDIEEISPPQVEIETQEHPPAGAVVPTSKRLALLVGVRLGREADRWQSIDLCDSIIGHPSSAAWLV